jgi:ferritin-like metal-binding protein YciE
MDVLKDLFEETLQRTLYAKTAIARALPIMMEAANSTALLAALSEHFEETKSQIKRLREVFALLGVNAVGEECLATDGHLLEARQQIAKTPSSPTLDAALLASVRAIQHYQMARYGTLREWAGELGLHDACRLLQKSLSEVEATDSRVSVLALTHVNKLAGPGAQDLEQIIPESRYTNTTSKITGCRQPPAFTGL